MNTNTNCIFHLSLYDSLFSLLSVILYPLLILQYKYHQLFDELFERTYAPRLSMTNLVSELHFPHPCSADMTDENNAAISRNDTEVVRKDVEALKVTMASRQGGFLGI